VRLGHVEGKGTIYDADGEVILYEDEVPYDRFEGVYLNVASAWRTWLVRTVFNTEEGAVVCTMTDKRILFIRRPDVYKAGAYLMTLYGAPEGVARMSKARNILEAGGFEYCEFTLRDIRFYKKIRAGVQLFVLVGGKKLNAEVGTRRARTIIAWLERNGIHSR
jgi:hypothetical protein